MQEGLLLLGKVKIRKMVEIQLQAQTNNSIGKFAKPKVGTPLQLTLIKLLQVGLPIIKDLVPSIGSMTHVKPLLFFLILNSSPMIPSFGNFLEISFLKNNSSALSIFVTGSKFFLFLDLLFNLNFPFNFAKYNLFIFFGSVFKNQ